VPRCRHMSRAVFPTVSLVALLLGCTAPPRETPPATTRSRATSATANNDRTATRSCAEAIGVADPTPERGVGKIVLERVWVPSAPPNVIHAAGSRTKHGNLTFKQGISVRAGAPVELHVPAAFRTRYSLDFAATPVETASPLGEGQTVIRIMPCPRGYQGPWTAFSGGLFAPRPVCAVLMVTSNGGSDRVSVGLGKAC
jgi:hypothetical protein